MREKKLTKTQIILQKIENIECLIRTLTEQWYREHPERQLTTCRDCGKKVLVFWSDEIRSCTCPICEAKYKKYEIFRSKKSGHLLIRTKYRIRYHNPLISFVCYLPHDKERSPFYRYKYLKDSWKGLVESRIDELKADGRKKELKDFKVFVKKFEKDI